MVRRRTNIDLSGLAKELKQLDDNKKREQDIERRKNWKKNYAWCSDVFQNASEVPKNRAIELALYHREHIHVLENILPRIEDPVFEKFPSSKEFFKNPFEEGLADIALKDLSDAFYNAAFEKFNEIQMAASEIECTDTDPDFTVYDCEHCRVLNTYYDFFPREPEEIGNELGWYTTSRQCKDKHKTKLNVISNFIYRVNHYGKYGRNYINANVRTEDDFKLEMLVTAMCDVIAVLDDSKTKEIRVQ